MDKKSSRTRMASSASAYLRAASIARAALSAISWRRPLSSSVNAAIPGGRIAFKTPNTPRDVRSGTVFISPQYKRQLGYNEHEMESNWDAWQSRVHPDDLPATMRRIEQCLVSASTFEAEFRIEQVALVTGHKDWKMLRRYTHLRPESLHDVVARRKPPPADED